MATRLLEQILSRLFVFDYLKNKKSCFHDKHYYICAKSSNTSKSHFTKFELTVISVTDLLENPCPGLPSLSSDKSQEVQSSPSAAAPSPLAHRAGPQPFLGTVVSLLLFLYDFGPLSFQVLLVL